MAYTARTALPLMHWGEEVTFRIPRDANDANIKNLAIELTLTGATRWMREDLHDMHVSLLIGASPVMVTNAELVATIWGGKARVPCFTTETALPLHELQYHQVECTVRLPPRPARLHEFGGAGLTCGLVYESDSATTTARPKSPDQTVAKFLPLVHGDGRRTTLKVNHGMASTVLPA